RRIWPRKSELRPHSTMFAATTLAGIGSACYHWKPNHDRLVFDRLPMSLAFGAMLASVLAERRETERLGKGSLLPLTVSGAATVIYWWSSEKAGRGDLRPYGWFQFFCYNGSALALLLFPSHSAGAEDVAITMGIYSLVPIFELLDRPIYWIGHMVSGHTLKHLAAAGAVTVLAKRMGRKVTSLVPSSEAA